MATNDTLAVALSTIMNAEKVGKDVAVVSPISKITTAVLEIMKDNRYIGAFELLDDGKGGKIKINLIGGINKCGVIKPRFSSTIPEFDKFEKRFLPAAGFGLMVVSTSKGIMTQSQARENKVGGKLLAFVY
jgi:small subunit ribosomal protein S8